MTSATASHGRAQPRRETIPGSACRSGLGGPRPRQPATPRRPAIVRTLPKSSCCPCCARTAQGYQSLVGERPDRRSCQTTHRQLSGKRGCHGEQSSTSFNLLLENTSLSQNRQTGEKSPTVRFVDFKQRENNHFLAVCQFKVRVLGTEHHIIPDIVLFLNGLPVVVIECKSPKVKDAIPEAIDQLLRYSEQCASRTWFTQ